MISKELLKSIMPTYDYMYIDELNTYELAHKCKEWAYASGFTVETYKKVKLERDITFIKIYCNHTKRYFKEFELAKTELYEADFKACQWILDNKDSK